MKAQSNIYIKLQNIYKDKARQDANEILATVRSKPGGEDIDPAEVELFSANARFIKLINPDGAPPSTLEQVAGKCPVTPLSDFNSHGHDSPSEHRKRIW